MWLLGRLVPDYKSIAEFRRMHRAAVTEAGAELVRFARSVGLVRGEWVAIDGSKFRAVSSAHGVREREAMKRYLDQMETADKQDGITIDASVVAAALEKLKRHPEPEARFMRMGSGHAPAYNVQTAVDAEHALIVAQQVTTEATDNRSLLPMAEAAKHAIGDPPSLNVVADAGYSNGEQAEGIVPMFRPIEVSTIKAMARCSIAAGLSTTTRPTPSAVPLARLCCANNCIAKIRRSAMPHRRKPAPLVP